MSDDRNTPINDPIMGFDTSFLTHTVAWRRDGAVILVHLDATRSPVDCDDEALIIRQARLALMKLVEEL